MSKPTEERTLTFMDKINIVQHLLCNVNAEDLAERFGTTLPKIIEIRHNHQTIMEIYKYYLQSQEVQLKGGHYPRMENILYAWYSDQTNKVTNKELGARARVIVDVLNEQSSVKNAFPFTGTNNWVNAFKTRYDINKKSSTTTMNWEFGSTSGVLNVSPGSVDGSANSDYGSPGNSLNNDPDNKVERMYAPRIADNATESAISEKLLTRKAEPEEFQFSNTDDSVAVKPDIFGSAHESEFDADAYQVQDIPTAVNIVSFGNKRIAQKGGDKSAHINQDISIDLSHSANEDTNDIDDTPIVVDLTDSQEEDGVTVNNQSLNNESLEVLVSKKRKRSSLSAVDNSSDDLSDSGTSSEKKSKLSDKMLSPQSNNDIEETSVEQYDKEKVIQIFKPLLKFADSHWSDDDRNDLERLFQKSVESCYTPTEDQPMITKFFRLKK